MKAYAPVLLGAALISTLPGCATNPQTGQAEIAPSVRNGFNDIFNSEDPCSNNDRNIGMAVGALAGGVIGYMTNGTKGAVAGAAIGVGGGFLIGRSMDARRCALFKIAQSNDLKMASATITPEKLDGKTAKLANASTAPLAVPSTTPPTASTPLGLDVQLQDKSDEFLPGSAKLTPQATTYISQIAAQYKPQAMLAALPPKATQQERDAILHRKILIVGHTDERDGQDGESLAALSQARAKEVAKLFAQQGIPAQNIFYQGAGDTLPIGSNATAVGREQNQRIQIVDVPTEADLQRYLRLRSVDPANYLFSSASEASRAQQAATGAPGKKSAQAASVANASPKIATNNNQGALDTKATKRASRKTSPAPVAKAIAEQVYNFGGAEIHDDGAPIALGKPVSNSMFSLVNSAYADTSKTMTSCLGDRPHVASSIQNLATDKKLDVRDYLPGFYGAPWMSGFNGNLIAVMQAKVPSDAGSPIPQPELHIFKDYKGDTTQKPTYSGFVPVNVYRGSDATLYRMFVKGPMQCIDLVVANNVPQGNGSVYYNKQGATFAASGTFALR